MEEKIIAFFEQAYRKEPGTLSRDTKIKEELGGSSLVMVAVIANIEEEFDVVYPLPEASKAETIGVIIDKVKSMA